MPGDFRHPSITPPTRPPHDFGYTPADLVDTYTPPEAGFAPRHTSYAYNADGQLTAVTRPDGQQLLLSYEASGRLDFVTLPTGVVDLSYDAASGRVSAVSAPGGFQSTFGYEGPLLTSIATSGPVAGAIGFSYDADLRLAGRTVAGSAPVAYQYDPDGLLVRAGELALGRETASGWLATTALGVTSDERTRTGFGELDVFTARIGGSVAYAYDLDRDAGGRITRRTETIGGATAVWEYGYHAERGWLTEVRRDGVPVASYGYDGNGNRTSWSDFWGSGAATYDAQDRQLTAGAKAFTYTANGERLTESEGPETTSYTYDVRGSLLGVELPDGIAIEYLVDASGRRIGKRVDGVLTQGWLYAGGLAPVAETDGTGSVTKTFVYGGQGHVPDYLVAGGTTYRMLTDHLGSVRLVVDATSGAVVQRLDYDAWGRITYDSNPGWQPFGFAGGLYDPQTGLVRFGARDYDPETGRWTAKDPIGFAGGSAGLYTYAENDPLNAIDPSGLAAGSVEAYRLCQERVEGVATDFLRVHAVARGAGDVAVAVGAAVSFAATNLVGSLGCAVGNFLSLAELPIEEQVGPALLLASLGAKPAPGLAAVRSAPGLGGASAGAAPRGTRVYRVWGRDPNSPDLAPTQSGPWGRSWTPVDPRTVPNFRNAAGLPEANLGRFVSEGVLIDTTGVESRLALPLGRNTGGIQELLVPNPQSQILLQRILGLNPEM